jgi:hypothetical protein
MSVAYAIPSAIRVLLSPTLQSEIVSAAYAAEQRVTTREQAAEVAAQALQWIGTEMDLHVRACDECRFRACIPLRRLRRQHGRAVQRYQRTLRQLRGAK